MTKQFSSLLATLSAALFRSLQFILLVTSLCLGLHAIANATSDTKEARITLEESMPKVMPWSAIRILPDASKKLNLEQVMATPEQFMRPTTAVGTLGLRTEAIWMHLPLKVADGDGLWVLDIDYPPLNRIEVYLTQSGRVVQQTILGNLQAYEQRPIWGRSHSFGLRTQAGAEYELYLRVVSNGTYILPITLSKPSVFHANALAEEMLQGVLAGLALCLLIYSLAQWINLKEPLFLKYAILVFGSLFFSLHQFGVASQYVWFGNTWFELHAGGLSALCASTGLFLFIEQALDGADGNRWLSRLMKLGACINVLIGIAYCFDLIHTQTVAKAISTIGIMPSVLGLPGAIGRARRGDKVGVYFLVAWTLYLFAAAILSGVIKGYIPANFWTQHSYQFGATFDMLVFMAVLGLRTKAIQDEMRQARSERDSFHFLAHSDPLTGLPNRRSLHHSIDTSVKHASASHILAVYMMDLDGFKQVNDQYGHDVGDELLIAVAARLRTNLRTSDVISRLGGDEFVVMSKDLNNPQQALELGEKLIRALDYPFMLAEHTCRVGLTIGYALAPMDGHDTATLLRRADAAMYAGKQAGKHCIRRGDAM